VSREFQVVYERGIKYYGVNRPQPILIFTTDLGSYVGWANCENWSIKVSVQGLREYPHYIISSTLPHEYAHLIHCELYGGLGADVHNPVWAGIMRDLGGDPNWKKVNYYE
jgi:predicted SprT family Zn-dependent metalloprotease